jgi:hypothetical protein
MSELTLMAETIRDAMRALEEAHDAGRELRRNNNHAASRPSWQGWPNWKTIFAN